MNKLDDLCPKCGEIVHTKYEVGMRKNEFVEMCNCEKCNWFSWNLFTIGEIIDNKRTKLIDKMLNE